MLFFLSFSTTTIKIIIINLHEKIVLAICQPALLILLNRNESGKKIYVCIHRFKMQIIRQELQKVKSFSMR